MDGRTAESLLDFAERADAGLKGLEVEALQAEVERRYAEILLALQWFIDAGRPEGALRLVSALAYFWRATGRMGEAMAWCDRALELGRRIGDPTVTALALVGQARSALRTEVEPARRLCREAIARESLDIDCWRGGR